VTTVHNQAASSQLKDSRRDRGATARLLAAAVLGVLLTLFAVLNSQSVRIHWIVTTTHVPMIVVIVGCGLIGAIVSWLIARRRRER
jgi:uncharacterized integral membrane protein